MGEKIWLKLCFVKQNFGQQKFIAKINVGPKFLFKIMFGLTIK